jgi:hypothetical protein
MNEHKRRNLISETTLMDCENVPPEMVARFDQAWHFVGEVNAEQPSDPAPFMRAICKVCHQRPVLRYPANSGPITRDMVPYVEMRGYKFITDDMIEVMVYFGICEKCDRVYWARSGPPFRRARCMEPITD